MSTPAPDMPTNTKRIVQRTDTNLVLLPRTVTHLSTNRAGRTKTTNVNVHDAVTTKPISRENLHLPHVELSLGVRFYRTKRSRARYCHGRLSVCLSVRLSVCDVGGL